MHGVYLLWWIHERHVPAPVVAAMLAAGDVVLMLLEVPTGWLADRLGHRRCLIAGSSVQTVAMLWCWLATDAGGVLIATLLVALGDALRSGADEALLYRSCVETGREQRFQSITARTRTIQLASQVALIAAGGVLVRTLGYAAGWITEVTCAAVGVAIACAMREPSPAAVEIESPAGPIAPVRVTRPRALLALILPVAWMGGLETIAMFLTQTRGDDVVGITAAVSTIVLAEAAGAATATRIASSSVRLQIALAAIASTMFVVGVTTSAGVAAAAMVISFCLGIAEPLRAAAMQRVATDTTRARIASLASACDKAMSVIALPIAGVLRR